MRNETCTHARCSRADEGACFFERVADALGVEAAPLQPVLLTVLDAGEHFYTRAIFRTEHAALSFRDVAAPKIAEAGLDYFSPAIRPNRERSLWEVSITLADGKLPDPPEAPPRPFDEIAADVAAEDRAHG